MKFILSFNKRKSVEISYDEPNNESHALLVKESSKQIITYGGNVIKRYYCSHYKISSHPLACCFKANPNRNGCSHCHMAKLATNTYYTIHGYPKGHKFYGKSKAFGAYAS